MKMKSMQLLKMQRHYFFTNQWLDKKPTMPPRHDDLNTLANGFVAYFSVTLSPGTKSYLSDVTTFGSSNMWSTIHSSTPATEDEEREAVKSSNYNYCLHESIPI